MLIAALLGGAGGFSAQEESVVLSTYADPVWGWSVPTGCAGETGPHIRPGMTFAVEQCLEMLDARLVQVWRELEPHIKRPITLGAALALVSLAMNTGNQPVASSTMLKLHNAGVPESVWCKQFTTAWARHTPFPLPVRKDGVGSVLEPIGWVIVAGRNCRDPKARCRGIPARREREEAMCLRDVAIPAEYLHLLDVEDPQ